MKERSWFAWNAGRNYVVLLRVCLALALAGVELHSSQADDDESGVPLDIKNSTIAADLTEALTNQPVEPLGLPIGTNKTVSEGYIKWSNEIVFAPRGPIDWSRTRASARSDVIRESDWFFEPYEWSQSPLVEIRNFIDKSIQPFVTYSFIADDEASRRWNMTVAVGDGLDAVYKSPLSSSIGREVAHSGTDLELLNNPPLESDRVPTDAEGNASYPIQCESFALIRDYRVVAGGIRILVPNLSERYQSGVSLSLGDDVIGPCLFVTLGIGKGRLPPYLARKYHFVLSILSNADLEPGMKRPELLRALLRGLNLLRPQGN